MKRERTTAMKTATAETKFTVSTQTLELSIEGDREIWDEEEQADYETLEAAIAAADEFANGRDAVKLNANAKRIGSIEHLQAFVTAYAYDAEEDEWTPCDANGDESDCAPLYAVDALDLDKWADLAQAFDKAQRGYNAFLDFKADGYDTVESILKEED